MLRVECLPSPSGKLELVLALEYSFSQVMWDRQSPIGKDHPLLVKCALQSKATRVL